MRRIPIKSRAATLSSLIDARRRLDDWRDQGRSTAANAIERNLNQTAVLMGTAPSGSGIDCGTLLSLERSTTRCLVFTFDFHHMNDGGYYDGWTEHTVTVTPSFDGIDLKISGRDRGEIKEHLYEVYHHWLESPAVEVWTHHETRNPLSNPPQGIEIDPETGAAFAVYYD